MKVKCKNQLSLKGRIRSKKWTRCQVVMFASKMTADVERIASEILQPVRSFISALRDPVDGSRKKQDYSHVRQAVYVQSLGITTARCYTGPSVLPHGSDASASAGDGRDYRTACEGTSSGSGRE